MKLSFWVCWHVMLLVCCRLQELELPCCYTMTDRGLLEGIGPLRELTSLRVTFAENVTAQAFLMLFHQPSMSSIMSLDLSSCCNLDDEGLKGIAERCNKLRYFKLVLYIVYMSKCSGVSWSCSASACVCLWRNFIISFYRCIHLKKLEVGECQNITDAGISMVVRQCSQLRLLRLSCISSITGLCALCENPEYSICFITISRMMILKQVHQQAQRPTTGPYCETA